MEIHFCGFHTRNIDCDRIYRPDGQEWYLFLLVLSRMRFTYADGRRETAEPGACILYTPGEPQDYCAEGKFLNSFVEFSYDVEKIDRLGLPCNRIFYPVRYEIYNEQIKRIHQEYLGKEPYREEMMGHYLDQLLLLLGRLVRTAGDDGETDMETYQRFVSVRHMMLWQCQKSWTTEQLCAAAHFEKSRFYQLYQKFFNCTPREDLISARLQLALYHMTNSSLAVSDAAYLAGFGNISYFNRLFKKRFGCTPGEYRKSAMAKKRGRVTWQKY